jgi:hypothetical protein
MLSTAPRLLTPSAAGFWFSFLCLLPGCGDGSGSSSGTAMVQMTDAAFTELTSFPITITEIDLLSTGGGVVKVFPPASSPSATLTVDLVSLRGRQELVALQSVPAVAFNGAQIAFQNATATTGVVGQTVTPAAGVFTTQFPESITVTPGQFSSIVLDIDGATSVVSTSPATVNFIPTTFVGTGDNRFAVAVLGGTVATVGNNQFVLSPNGSGFATIATPIDFGTVPVLVEPLTLFRIDGLLFVGRDGLALLPSGATAQVTGRLTTGGVSATQVMVDVTSGVNPIRVNGQVVSTSSPAVTLRFNQIGRDQNGQLATTAAGSSLVVATSSSTTFTRQVGTMPVAFTSLFPGQSVDVVGALTSPANLNAASVNLRETSLAGTLVTVNSPALTAHMTVDSANGVAVSSFPGLLNVTLDLSQAQINVGGIVPVQIATLGGNQKVVARGFFTAADRFLVDELDLVDTSTFTGTVVSENLPTSTFIALLGGVPVQVMLSDSTRFGLRTTSQPNMFANVTEDGFFTRLNAAPGPIFITGQETGSNLRATEVVSTTP